jgi:hypothetical protein
VRRRKGVCGIGGCGMKRCRRSHFGNSSVEATVTVSEKGRLPPTSVQNNTNRPAVLRSC